MQRIFWSLLAPSSLLRAGLGFGAATLATQSAGLAALTLLLSTAPTDVPPI